MWIHQPCTCPAPAALHLKNIQQACTHTHTNPANQHVPPRSYLHVCLQNKRYSTRIRNIRHPPSATSAHSLSSLTCPLLVSTSRISACSCSAAALIPASLACSCASLLSSAALLSADSCESRLAYSSRNHTHVVCDRTTTLNFHLFRMFAGMVVNMLQAYWYGPQQREIAGPFWVVALMLGLCSHVHCNMMF